MCIPDKGESMMPVDNTVNMQRESSHLKFHFFFFSSNRFTQYLPDWMLLGEVTLN